MSSLNCIVFPIFVDSDGHNVYVESEEWKPLDFLGVGQA